jgi:hypothetical protein
MGDVLDVAVDTAGRVHVVDNARNTVWIFNPDGTFSGYLNSPASLTSPVSIAIDATNNAYVAEGYTSYYWDNGGGPKPGQPSDIQVFNAGTNNAPPINSWGVEPIFDFPDWCCYGGHGWGYEAPIGVRIAPGGGILTISTLVAESYCCLNDPDPVPIYWTIWCAPGQACANYSFTVPSDGAAQYYVPCLGIGPDGSPVVVVPTEGYITAYSPACCTIPITPDIWAQPQSVVTSAYSSVEFSVGVSGTAPLSFQWQFNGTNLPGATSSRLTITNVTQDSLGSYSVVVSNNSGSTSSTTALLEMAPFLAAPFPGGIFYQGQPAIFGVVAWGTTPLNYQWFFNGVPLAGATNSVLSFAAIQSTNAGLYCVVVTNALGSITNCGPVQVNPTGVSLGLYPGLTLTGPLGLTNNIQVTTDLSNTNSWVNLTNVVLVQTNQLWIDTSTDASLPRNPRRYYKVQQSGP